MHAPYPSSQAQDQTPCFIQFHKIHNYKFEMQVGWRSASKDQESHIDEIHELAKRMRIAGHQISEQLQKQDQRIGVFHHEMQATEGRLGDLQKEVGELLETHDVNQVCTCMMLCCFMIVLIILVIIF